MMNACSLSLQRARQKKREKDETGEKETRSTFSLEKAPGRPSREKNERMDGGRLGWSIKARPVFVQRKITKTEAFGRKGRMV